jgi:hypothetical protein
VARVVLPFVSLPIILKNLKDSRRERVVIPFPLPDNFPAHAKMCLSSKKPFTRFQLLTIIEAIRKNGFDFLMRPVAAKID